MSKENKNGNKNNSIDIEFKNVVIKEAMSVHHITVNWCVAEQHVPRVEKLI